MQRILSEEMGFSDVFEMMVCTLCTLCTLYPPLPLYYNFIILYYIHKVLTNFLIP